MVRDAPYPLGLAQERFRATGRDGKEVEVDETFIGDAARFMHRDRHRCMITGIDVVSQQLPSPCPFCAF